MQFRWRLLAKWSGVDRQAILLTCLLFLLKTSFVNSLRINSNVHRSKVPAVFFATEGGSVSLTCPCAQNDAVISVSWMCPKQQYFSQFSQQLISENNNKGTNGSLINNNYNYNSGFARRTIVNGSLEITPVCESDVGIYKCFADTECVYCEICQATVELRVARIGGKNQSVIQPACSVKQLMAQPVRYHYSDWTYGALIFSAGLVLGLALAMFIVIFRRRSRKRFGSRRRSDFSFSKDSLIRCRSIIERQKTASMRRTQHLLQKTRTMSHRWLPIREESFQECESSFISAFDDAPYGMYVNPLRSRHSTRGSSIPMGPPPLPPRPRPTKNTKDTVSSISTISASSMRHMQEVSDEESEDDYEEAPDETALIKDGDKLIELVKMDNLEDCDGYVKMTIPSRPCSEMPSLDGRSSAFQPNSSILKNFAIALVPPPESKRNGIVTSASRMNQLNGSYIELVA